MKVFLTSLALLACSSVTAAQCEIDRIDSEFGFRGGAFQGGRLTLVNGAFEAESLVAGADGWELQSVLPPVDLPFLTPHPLPVGHFGAVRAVGMDWVADHSGTVIVVNGDGTRQLLVPQDAAPWDAFGFGLAVHDDLVVVGASGYVEGAALGPGKAYVFERVGPGSAWTQAATFRPYGFGNELTLYGAKLSTDGERIVIGSRGEDHAGFSYAGAAYVYERAGSGWVENAKLHSPTPSEDALFGIDVAIQGSTLLVGESRSLAGSGRAHVFELGPAGWVPSQVLQSSAPVVGDGFGLSVDLEADRAAIGAPFVSGGAPFVGAAYVFERTPSGWVSGPEFVADDAPVQSRYGTEVDLDGNQLLMIGSFEPARLYSLGIDDAVNECSSSPNSSGAAATIAVEGCDSRIANDFALRADDLPSSATGLFFYGTDAAHVPLGNGTLCVRAPHRRLALTQAGRSWRAAYPVGLPERPGSGDPGRRDVALPSSVPRSGGRHGGQPAGCDRGRGPSLKEPHWAVFRGRRSKQASSRSLRT